IRRRTHSLGKSDPPSENFGITPYRSGHRRSAGPHRGRVGEPDHRSFQQIISLFRQDGIRTRPSCREIQALSQPARAMPQIKPFCGIYPKQEYVERVIAAPPGFPLSDADRAELTANPNSFLHLIAPPLKNEFLQGPRDALIHRQAAENFQRFLEEGILIKDPEPGLYLYTLEREGILQTGIWTVTLFDDYLNNRVRKHEYTRADRERSIAEYLRQTGIDANPVLIAYPPHGGIERIIEKYRSQPPLISLNRADSRHTLHRVSAPEDLNRLRGYFNELPAAYLADGHHRAAALSSYGVERRKFNFRHTGEEEYNFFSSIYFSADSLEIKSFHRLIKDLNGLHPAGFIEK